MTADQAVAPGTGEVALPPRWPLRRILAWALIGLGIIGFVIAGDVRTAWIVGDVAPLGDEVAIPRLATIALLIGILLLAAHQLRARRALPETRYRGPSVLVLLVLTTALAGLVILPVRGTINRAFEGGIPDLVPVLIWTLATPLALILVTWLMLRANVLPGLTLFRDARPWRHALFGIAVGGVTQIALLVIASLIVGGSVEEPVLQTQVEPMPGGFLSGQPFWLAIVSAVILAPVAEELFFRGLALHAWLREYGTWVALIGSSALFGLVHYGLFPLDFFISELPLLVRAAIIGVVLGILALRTGSLIAPMAAHATMNAIPVILVLTPF